MPPTCWKYVNWVISIPSNRPPSRCPTRPGRRLPVVLFEADVVLPRVDAAGFQGLEIEILHLVGRGLEDHLELVVLEQAVRVLAKTPVVGASRRLHVGDVPMRRTEHAQQRLGMRGAGADFEVQGLLNQAAIGSPRSCCSLKMRSWKVKVDVDG